MNIYFFDVKNWEKSLIPKYLSDFQISLFKKSLTAKNVNKFQNADIISVFLETKITKEIIEKLPNLKFISTRSTGFNHIDIKYAKEKNILVSNVPHYGENTVAEYTFGLILALSRKIFKAYIQAKNFNFSCENLTGFDLKNKILGVIGVGNIGRHVIKIAKGFDMKVIAFDTRPDQELSKKLEFKYKPSLESVLSKSDVITLHVPYNKHTHHMINKNTIKLIKPGCIIINTSRGGIIQTEALIEGLEKNIISGAGLDVLEGEGQIKEEKVVLSKECTPEQLQLLITNYLLLKKENVIITPHNAFNSNEAIERIIKTTSENIKNFLKNSTINLVN